MRILIVRYKLTRGVPEGGEKASEQNRSVLCHLAGNENVDTCYIHDEAHRRTVGEYLKGVLYMPFGYYFGLTPHRVREIVSKAQAYDVVFIDRSVFGIVAKQLRASGYKGRIVCFFHNVETLYFSAKYAPKQFHIPPITLHLPNPMRWLVVPCANRNDRWSCHYADSTIALSRRDDEALFRLYGRHADQLIPITLDSAPGVDDTADPSALTAKRPLCMFLGAYFPANVEGIEWFVRHILPKVDIRMQIVGKGMDRLRDADWMFSDIEVLSDVPDLRPLFEAADVMVLPIFKGSGMKVKTCESLMYGKNIIGSTEAWAGYELDYAKAGAFCATAQDFVDALNDFCQHPRPRFNAYSRQVFLENYSTDRMVDKFRAAVGG